MALDAHLLSTLERLQEQSQRVRIHCTKPYIPGLQLTVVGYVRSCSSQMANTTVSVSFLENSDHMQYLLIDTPPYVPHYYRKSLLQIEQITSSRKRRNGTYPLFYQRTDFKLDADGALDMASTLQSLFAV